MKSVFNTENISKNQSTAPKIVYFYNDTRLEVRATYKKWLYWDEW